MTWLRGALVRMAAVIFPWAPRHERHAAIQAAVAEKERSRAGKEHAKAVEAEIRRYAKANHYAEAITNDILRGHRGGERA